MKRIILSVAIILAFGVIGCKSGSDDPKGVLKSFMEALAKKDIEAGEELLLEYVDNVSDPDDGAFLQEI